MATPVTLDEMMGKVGVTHAQLDKTCSPENLRDIALFLESWREVAPHLGLSSAQLEAIERDARSEQEKRLKILESWEAAFAFKATYRVLVEVLLKISRANLAEKVCRLLVQQQPSNDNHSNCLPGASQGSITVNSCQHYSALTQLHKEIKDLEDKYGVLTDNVLSALKKEDISLDKIKSYLRQLPVSLKQQCHKFLQSQTSRLINAPTIDELFWILSDYWDFINPSLLVDLAHKFGDDQTKASVDMYMKELKEFRMRTKLKDFINQWTGQPRPDFHEIVLEFKDDWREYTLEQLEEFRNAFLCKQWLERYAMPLRGIKEACVAAVFSLPMAVDSQDLKNLCDFFQEHQILRVFLSGTCIINIQYMDYENEVRQMTDVESKDEVRQMTDVESKDEVRQSSNCSEQASQIMQMANLVCKKCFKDNPSRIDLITHKCFQESLHLNESRVKVEWVSSSNYLKQLKSGGALSSLRASIRPMPRAFFRGKFVLCNRGKRCKGKRCTFPHSVEERDAWNAEKFGRLLETTQQPKFEGISRPEWPSLPPSQPLEPFQQPQQAGPSPWPDHYELGAKPFLCPVQTPMVAQAVSTSPHLQLSLQAAELPQRNQHPPALASTLTFKDSGTGPQQDYAAKATEFLARVQQVLRIEDIRTELTQGNYKEKMHKLLCWEEKAHIEILGEKCNGQYTLVLHQAGLKQLSWMRNETNQFHVRFGYLLGLNGDQIAYATQASEGAYIVHEGKEVKVDILMENFSHTDERMYIALDRSNLEKLEKVTTLSISRAPYHSPVKIKVEFELKHSYFNNLHTAVEQLSPEVIARILPQAQEFRTNQHLQIPDLQQYKQYCSQDQLNALQTIATCPSNGPPVLIAGAFGTGKTHILAVTAHYLFKSSKGNQPARVLVCTQQRASADTFLEYYIKLMGQQGEEIYLIQDYGFKNPNLKRWYRTVAQFGSYIDRSSYRNRSNFLIVAPCLTVLHLANSIPRGFFTHILLDEGAQTREPEAVAPLCMADRNTKIVIAGDQNQVGPAMLVLGDEAQKNGLAVSLLERLHTLYGKLGKVAGGHCATLVTNYRCHHGILKLAEKLFYDLELKCNVPDSAAHPAAPYPLLFYCSSIDDKVQSTDSTMNKQEAEITLKLAAEFAKKWPSASWGPVDLSQMCFMSPTRSQLIVANQLISQLKLYQLKRMCRLPTYDVQGREFRALFLSTSEPTDKDGATLNPTKSICDRYVFNTAITRAQSLVVAVGNPFMLLCTERHMVQKYGTKGKCWSNYFKFCLEHGTLFIRDSLQVTEAEKSRCMQKLQKLVEEHLARSSSDIWRAEDAVNFQQPPQQQKKTAPFILLPTSGASVRHPGDGNWSLQSRPTVMASPQQFVPRRQPKQPPHHPPLSTYHPPSTQHSSPPPSYPYPSPQAKPKAIAMTGALSVQPTQLPPPPYHCPAQPQNSPPTTECSLPPPCHPHPPIASSLDTGTPYEISSQQKFTHVQEEVHSTDVHGSAPTSKLEKDYDVKKRLGKGGFGVVYHVRSKLDRQEYAVKIIELPSRKSDQEKVMREVVFLAHLNHPKIVRYYTSWIERAPPGWSENELWAALKSSESTPYADQSPCPTASAQDDSSPPSIPNSASTPSRSTDESVGDVKAESSTTEDSAMKIKKEDQKKSHGHKPPDESTKGAVAATTAPATPLLLEPSTLLFIQTELCREETLYHWLRKHIRNRPRKMVLTYFNQILEAVVYIHEKGLVHRDLKPSNIFFSREGEGNLKVGDFGLVTVAGIPSLKPLGAKLKGQSYSSVAGTHFYMSPEQKAGVQTPPDQTQKIDIFALGVIFFELCCPLSTKTKRFKVLTNLREQKAPQKFTDNFPIEAELIRTLLEREPSKRPTAEHVHNCDPMKRLRKKLKKSQACIPVL